MSYPYAVHPSASAFAAYARVGTLGPPSMGPPPAFYARPPYAPPYGYRVPMPMARVGFTSPTFTYTLMREIQAHAAELDTLVETNVVSNDFRVAWKRWYDESWRPFYDTYANPSTSSSWSKLGAAFDSDSLAARAQEFRAQLEDFSHKYSQLKTPSGQPVPQPASSPPPEIKPRPADETFHASDIPWWAWTLGAAGLLGLGAYGYHRWIDRSKGKKR